MHVASFFWSVGLDHVQHMMHDPMSEAYPRWAFESRLVSKAHPPIRVIASIGGGVRSEDDAKNIHGIDVNWRTAKGEMGVDVEI